ncbi:hypothetical protein DVH05_009328 [Phytophthora capsici]|nr:hypothetical protein DVH05_009328 [Phytophthora capsici]
MPNTTFLDEEDRGLVQLARRYAVLGTGRIPWKRVAHELKRWKRSSVELAQRMNSLKRTYGTDLTKFPSSFFSPIRAARGRRSAHVELIRHPRARETSTQNDNKAVLGAPERGNHQGIREIANEGRDTSVGCAGGATTSRTMDSTCGIYVSTAVARNFDVYLAEPSGVQTALNSSSALCHVAQPTRAEKPITETSHDSCSSRRACIGDKVVSQIVSTLFKDIARREVVYPASEPHLNAGELLPDGVISQIKAIQRINPIQSRDVFLDIGSGVGNVVAQFALSTKVRACIGIEIRRVLADRCNAMLVDHVAEWARLQNVEVYAEDVNQIDLSLTYPFSSATIVLANNLRFEPSTTLHITNELLFLTDAWLVVFTSEVCPRHSSTCSNVFCTRWKLETVATLKVSWTATLVPAYLYTERK